MNLTKKYNPEFSAKKLTVGMKLIVTMSNHERIQVGDVVTVVELSRLCFDYAGLICGDCPSGQRRYQIVIDRENDAENTYACCHCSYKTLNGKRIVS